MQSILSLVNQQTRLDSGRPLSMLPFDFSEISRLEIAADGVHVWKVNTAVGPARLKEVEEVLSDDELERAQRFRDVRDRARFVMCRAVLRTLLAFYLQCSARQLRFSYSETGRPELDGEWHRCGLHFNVSHSGEVGLIVFSYRQVGIDIERLRKDIWIDGIAARCFSTLERSVIGALNEHERTDAFFSCWTRKEAYLKALGKGFSAPTIDFDVSCSPGEPARLIDTRSDQSERYRWEMHEVHVDTAYKAAVVVGRAAAN